MSECQHLNTLDWYVRGHDVPVGRVCVECREEVNVFQEALKQKTLDDVEQLKKDIYQTHMKQKLGITR